MDISSLLSPSDDTSSPANPVLSPIRPNLTDSNASSTTSVTSAIAAAKRSTPPTLQQPPLPVPLQNTSVPQTTEEIGLDGVEEVMADVPEARIGRAIDPEVRDVISEEEYHKIEEHLVKIAREPYRYDRNVDLLSFLRTLFLEREGEAQKPLLRELRKAREETRKAFAMKETLLLDWFEDEYKFAKDLEEILYVMELCTKSVEEQQMSVRLWKCYAEFVEEQYAAVTNAQEDSEKAGAKDLFTYDFVVETYRAGAQATSNDIADSHELWNKYRDLVMQDMEKDPTSPTKLDVIYNLYEARLQIPHATISDTFSAFSSFVTQYDNAHYEEIMVQYNKLYAAASAKWSDREIYEMRLKREREAYPDPRIEEWNIWVEYLEWETKQPGKKLDIDMACSLYERCLLRWPEQAKVWEDYFYFLLDKANDTAKTTDVLRRATKYCPWSGTLWAHYIVALERGRKPFDQVAHTKHTATSTELLDVGGKEELLKVNVAWCGYLKRRAFEADSEEDYDTAEMGIAEAVNEFGKDDPQYRLQRIQINFYTLTKDTKKARDYWKALMASYSYSYEFWLRYYEWELANGTKENAGSVIKQALNNKTVDWPEKILETWKNHVEDYGNAKEVEHMMVRYRKIFNELTERRQKEQQAAVEQAMYSAQIAQQQAGQLEDTTDIETERTKRRRSVVDSDGSHPTKKSKLTVEEEEEEEAKPATVVLPTHAPPTAEQTAKRDRENLTVIVKNIPRNYPVVKMRQFFRNCGTINALKVVNDKNGESATATVEFDTKEDVQAAQTRDKKTIEGRTIDVQVGTGATLYVTNFPPVADEAYIRDLFQECGEIVDVRFPSLKYNQHRRFCYVQFASAEQAQKATSLDGKKLGDKQVLEAKISAPNKKKERSGATQEGREVYIRNISFQADEKDIRELFEKYGAIERLKLPPGPRPGTHKGFGFVAFTSEEAAKASTTLNGSTLRSRELVVTIAEVNPTGKAKPGNAMDTVRSMSPSNDVQMHDSPDQTNGVPSPKPSATSTSPPPPSREMIDKKTLGIMNLPDTINDTRIRTMFEKFGPLRKVTLRPDHEGAIVEYENVADAGKAALAMEGHQIDGRKMEIGGFAELMKRKPAKKVDRGFQPKKALVPPSVVANRNAGQGSNRGKRRGLGFSGALARKKEGGGADVEVKDSGEGNGGEKKGGGGGGKSNEDFKKMFLS